MDVVTITAILVGTFVVSHLALASPPLRTVLVDRLGQVKHTAIVAFAAWGSLGPLCWYYGTHAHEGPPGLGLGHLPGVWWPSAIGSGLGIVLMVGIVAPSGYLRSASVVFGQRTNEPRGVERITRHPFFVGLLLWSVGHMLLASRMAGVVLFGALAVMAGLGGVLQDAKLRRLRGDSHEAYLRVTSFVPLLAVLRGRQRIVAKELPWLFWGLGIGVAAGVWALHGSGFAYGWVLVLVLLVLVPLWFAVASAFRHHRARSHGPQASPHRRP